MASLAEEQKEFIPLENNPEVMTALIHELGLSPTLQFYQVFSLSDPEMLKFIPRPAYALILISPVSHARKELAKEEDKKAGEYTGKGEDEPVIWYRQTIVNACGLIALLHVISNGKVRDRIVPNSFIAKFIDEAVPLDATSRAELIYNSPGLEKAHSAAAQQGSTAPPPMGSHPELHFIAFVKDSQNGLWELEGGRAGPIKLGQLAADEDLLSEQALDLTVRRYIREEKAGGENEERFSLLALGPT